MNLMTTISNRANFAPEGSETPGATTLYPEATPPVTPVDPPAGEVTPPVVPPTPPAGETPESVLSGKPPGEAPATPAVELTLESYELKLPEGFTPDESALGDFKKTALEAKLPPEQAQSFLDLYAAQQQKQLEGLQAQHQSTQAAWLAEIDQMPDFQGERRTQTLQVLGSAMKEYGTPEVEKILQDTGLGNHPAVVKYIFGMAKALSEGKPLAAKGPPSSVGVPRTAGEIMYPNMVKRN